ELLGDCRTGARCDQHCVAPTIALVRANESFGLCRTAWRAKGDQRHCDCSRNDKRYTVTSHLILHRITFIGLPRVWLRCAPTRRRAPNCWLAEGPFSRERGKPSPLTECS